MVGCILGVNDVMAVDSFVLSSACLSSGLVSQVMPCSASDIYSDASFSSASVVVADDASSVATYSSYSVYDGSISSTYVSLFDRLSSKFGYSDYVFFRSGQYTYSCFWGDLALSGSSFFGSGLDSVVLTVSSSAGTSYYTWSYSDNVDLSLSAGSALVYSSLGSYPVLDSPSVGFDIVLLFLLVVALIACFVRGIFAFTYRFRGNGQSRVGGRQYGKFD